MNENTISKKAVIYVRMLEREPSELKAQSELLHKYATDKGFDVVDEFIHVREEPGEKCVSFKDMIEFLRTHDDVRNVIVEKKIRLASSSENWSTIRELANELNIAVYSVEEGRILIS